MNKKEFFGNYTAESWKNPYNHSCRLIGWELYNLDIVKTYNDAQSILIYSSDWPRGGSCFNFRDLKITEDWLDE